MLGETMAGASLCQGNDFKGASHPQGAGLERVSGGARRKKLEEMRARWLGAGDTCWPHGAEVTEGAAHSSSADTEDGCSSRRCDWLPRHCESPVQGVPCKSYP